ncbi:MAG: hypothetical protein HC831_29185 [Chloroflexia bacterium]|nr:hypothetical protein [Chloroflexia bacterium]
MVKSRFEISDKNNGYTPASSFIENMTGEKAFRSNEVYHLDLGTGFEKRIRILYMDFHLGLNLSYTIKLNRFEWRTLQGEVVDEIPSVKNDGLKFCILARFEVNWEKMNDYKLFKKKKARK